MKAGSRTRLDFKLMAGLLILFPSACLAQITSHQLTSPSSFDSFSQPEWLDLHYHWEGHSDLDEMIRLNRAQGIRLGVTGEGGDGWGLNDDGKLEQFMRTLQGKPVYRGLQVYGLGWQTRYSKRVLSQLDYIAADALLFPDKDGHVVALWESKALFSDAQDFMERYVAYNLRVLAEPINIWCNPTYLPSSLQSKYEQLWTQERMLQVINAAAKNHVAIEINSKYNIPSIKFLKLAKQAGCRFSLGSNRHDREPGNLDYSIRMDKECGLTPQDMYLPTRK